MIDHKFNNFLIWIYKKILYLCGKETQCEIHNCMKGSTYNGLPHRKRYSFSDLSIGYTAVDIMASHATPVALLPPAAYTTSHFIEKAYTSRQ